MKTSPAMLAFTVKNHRLAAVRKPLPRLRPGWALIKLRLAGICNTDVEILRGYHNFRGTPGHEFVGEVIALGKTSPREKSRWLGRRVVGEINIACAALGFRSLCAFCRRGLKTHCSRRKVLGILHHDGAFAEYFSLPLENLYLVPKNVTDEQAVFTEPLAAACQILAQVPAARHHNIAVLGDGKLAQLIARVLRTAARNVTLFGKHESKLALARLAKIKTQLLHGDASDIHRIQETFSLVVEATGSPTGLSLAQHITEPRGTLVLKSTFHGAAPVETWPTVVKELTLIGSRCGPFGKALALLRSHRVDPTPLISRTFPLAEAPAAIAHAQKSGVMKVLLKTD
ncbi:MAG: alcohol dehydrogenase catalytic domain-containing protein [Acidobacteriia bacterium]|nr:alcohol dehydrogenase catalytic domain-containing protein [Terriglobia bacterium]